MAILIDGKYTSQKIREQIKKETEKLVQETVAFGAKVILCIAVPYDEVSDVAQKNMYCQCGLDESSAFVRELAEKYDNTLSGLLISNNIVNTLSASLTTVVFTAILGEGGVGVATAVITVLLVVFGEVSPKTMATIKADSFSLLIAGIIDALMILLTPIIFIINKLAYFCWNFWNDYFSNLFVNVRDRSKIFNILFSYFKEVI